ncbi:AraC family transcriptional regulator [Lentilactobacillus sp. IMAU92037]|uniref:helix-turn-helix transcriptional regulator n=1 Tax=Lentilactobacillus TaxID=2767893 RepID=UPI001C2C493A|nr:MULTISPECIES: AraC family transcriptional regulator [Lentilactobacillus]MBV0929407.1 AraC family transcriptional regulator [Lentilactobacillus dabitei]MDM7515795.1 AraC family transcriptional regulator [Lentilactobacillus sp. TOM.63]
MPSPDYQQSAKLFHSATQLNIAIYSHTGDQLLDLTDSDAIQAFHSHTEFHQIVIQVAAQPANRYLHFVTATKLEYLIVGLIKQPQSVGMVVVGPFITNTFNREAVNDILIDNSYTVSERRRLEQLYQGLLILSSTRIADIGALLVNLFNHALIQPKPVKLIDKRVRPHQPTLIDVSAESQVQIEKRYLEEQELIDAIAAGNKQGVEQQQHSIARITELFSNRIPHQPLRSTKNISFVYNTLCRIAAHRGGVQPVYLNDISEKYALLIERQNTVSGLKSLTAAMALEYCALVDSVSTNQYSPMIKRAADYILLNLGHHISLAQIATEIGTNPSYLSRKFKAEVGLTITDYLNEKRISEARKYLERPTPSVTGIALMTGFNNVTYFIKVFKRVVGQTPLDYRNSVGRR